MSGIDLRRTGIGVVGDVPWGTHFFLFHETKDDLLDTLTPYFKAGLEGKELCMWVISDPMTEGQACAALAQHIPNLHSHLKDQSMQIVRGREWYMSGDDLNLDKVAEGWSRKIEFARSRGYSGLRLSADTAWLERGIGSSFPSTKRKSTIPSAASR